MPSNVTALPIENNRMYLWFTQYAAIRRDEGESAANVYLYKTVPAQLHKQLRRLYRLTFLTPSL
jgi:hypothetical protein